MSIKTLESKGWEVSTDVVENTDLGLRGGRKRYTVSWPDGHDCEELTLSAEQYCVDCGAQLTELDNESIVGYR